MRETRLFDYGNVHDSGSFTSADIIFTSSEFDDSGIIPGTWAGLARETIAWRVEEGRSLIVENIVTHKGFRLNFSTPLTCRPLVLAESRDSSTTLEALVSCYTSKNSSVLIRMRLNIPASGTSTTITHEEICRRSIASTWITCMAAVDSDYIVGRKDGSCAIVKFKDGMPARMDLIPFAPSAHASTESNDAREDTSMISGASGESAPSQRSVASSMSFGLMTRFFGSPRVGAPSAGGNTIEASSQDLRLTSSSMRPSREEKRGSYWRSMDAVLCLAKITMSVKAFVSLHESGRVCVFTGEGATYECNGDIMLPVTLAKGLVTHFLAMGLPESVIAAVVADEDPNADSLRVFNITAKRRGERSLALAATQIAARMGPIDRIVSAALSGEDVIVGSQSGFISGVLNVPSDGDDGVGIPTGTLWTALDDMEQPFGLSEVLNSACSNPKDQLLQAHRFSVVAVAKALRMENPAMVSRLELETTVMNTVFDQDDGNMWHRVKARAEHIMRSEELQVRDMCVVDGVGLVVARQRSLFVLRGLLDSEKRVVQNRAHLLLDREPIKATHPACFLASHGLCQVLGAQYSAESADASAKAKLKFMLSVATSFSGVEKEIPLTDRLAQKLRGEMEESSSFSDLKSTIQYLSSALEPGAPLLQFLQGASELDLLLIAAEQASNALPVSSMFASGISWLRKRTSSSFSLTNSWIDKSSQIGQSGPDPAAWRIEKAYAFFLTASQWSVKGAEVSERDIRCAVELAGLTADEAAVSRASGDEEDVIMEEGTAAMGPAIQTVSLFRDHLGFWLLERAVRMLETSGASQSAAAASLEAMELAPDTKRFEMMRASAFTRFLDSGSLEHALNAILRDPLHRDNESSSSLESSALRDTIGLLVDAVADKGMLNWLAQYRLPEPLGVLCGLALQRRARASEAFKFRHVLDNIHSKPDRMEDSPVSEGFKRPINEYEQLYAWHILRDDLSNAATSALEWGERLSAEGLSTIRNAFGTEFSGLSTESKLKLLLEWGKAKCEALGYALAATQLEPPHRRFIASSRFSLSDNVGRQRKGIVSESWVSRRLLLAHAQSRVLTRMVCDEQSSDLKEQFVQFVASVDSVLLLPQAEGLRWVIAMMGEGTSYENMLLSAELASAWREEAGDELLIEVVQLAAAKASDQNEKSFSYPELDNLLGAIVSTGGVMEESRNWNLIALESALSTSAGAIASPQWLVDAAAWGSDAFAEGTSAKTHVFSGRRRGDAAGVVRALLRNRRPVDAAKVLMVGLKSARKTGDAGDSVERFYIPYSAIDATMEMLAQCADDYPDAGLYRERLEELTTGHVSRMEKRVLVRAGDSMEVEAV